MYVCMFIYNNNNNWFTLISIEKPDSKSAAKQDTTKLEANALRYSKSWFNNRRYNENFMETQQILSCKLSKFHCITISNTTGEYYYTDHDHKCFAQKNTIQLRQGHQYSVDIHNLLLVKTQICLGPSIKNKI